MKGFNGDRFIQEKFEQLINQFGIKTVIETGSHHGDTTEVLANMMKDKGEVLTIEISEKYLKIVMDKLKDYNNVKIWKGNSPEVLKEVIPNVDAPILFYLDAHWYEYNPLLDELKRIAEFGLIDSCIAIHDFKVPDKDFGYDTTKDGHVYDIDYIKKSLDLIYGDGFYNIEYNEQASGAMRGIIYITPKG